MLGKETELMHANFINLVHSWWDDCDHFNSTNQGLNLNFPELKLFDLCCTNEMSAGWKLTKKGGCYKTKKIFCYYCDKKSDYLHIPNENICDHCNYLLNHHPEKNSPILHQNG